MMKPLKSILFASLLTVASVSASAMTAGSTLSAEELIQVLSEETRKCPTLDCAGSRVQLAAVSSADFTALPRENRSVIREKMLELARDLWPDTILEGPYHVKFNIRIERENLQMLIVDGQFMGYRVLFSDKAWDMDRCEPMTSPQAKQNLADCLSGRIFDRGFITKDFSAAFRDESSVAEFIKD